MQYAALPDALHARPAKQNGFDGFGPWRVNHSLKTQKSKALSHVAVFEFRVVLRHKPPDQGENAQPAPGQVRLQDEGVPTEIVRADGLIHGFFGMHAFMPPGEHAWNVAVRALRDALHGTV